MRILNPWRDLGALPREAWLLFWTNLVNRAGLMVLPFLILYLTTERGLSAARAGIVLSAYGLTSIAGAPLAGRLSDRIGSLPVMRVSLAMTGVLLFAYPYAKTFPQLIAVTVLWSLMDVSFRPASLKLMTESVEPAHRKSAFALVRLAINLGMSIGPALGGFLAAVSFRAIFVVDAITSIAAAGILFFFRTRASPADAPIGNDANADPGRTKSLMTNSPFILLLIGMFLISVVFFQHEGALPLFLVQSLGQSTAFYGILFTINTVIIVALEIPLNSATAHWPHSRSMGLGSALITVGFGALAFATTPSLVVVTVLFWTFGEMLLFPSLSAYLGDIAPAASRGVYMGAYTTSTQLGFALGTSFGAYLFARAGIPTVWIVMLVIGTIGTIVLVYSARGHKHHAAEVELSP
ncbi:MAG: MFS transporter [Gemmatimonadaceae bacterium]|nr:MFS transporter [Gemmatimonadaceae bacterium]